jgi:hypothetical protein
VKSPIVWMWSLVVMGVVALGSAAVEAQTVATGPYYAVPSWDQKVPASTRFVVLSNFNLEAVLDRETGLVWQRAPDMTRREEFQFAALDCLSTPFSGRGGWRLPTVSELSSLMESDTGLQFSGHLPAGHPFAVTPAFTTVFWTATAAAGVDLVFHSFWTLRLNVGGASYAVQSGKFDSTEKALVWCVRGYQAD